MTLAILPLIIGTVTIVRIAIVVGATLGAVAGAIIGITKLVPERAATIVGYQDKVLNNLVEENKRQAKRISSLEERVAELEKLTTTTVD